MAVIEISQHVDARGLSCPMPIVKTAQAIKTVASGELIEVLATDPGSVKDLAAWSKTTGQRARRAIRGRRRLPLRPAPEVRDQR